MCSFSVFVLLEDFKCKILSWEYSLKCPEVAKIKKEDNRSRNSESVGLTCTEASGAFSSLLLTDQKHKTCDLTPEWRS